MGYLRVFWASLFLFAFSAVGIRADEAAIHKFLRQYVDTFNKQDLDSVSAMWAENATWVDRETGERTEGRAAIRADLAEVFKKPKKTRLAGSVDRVRLIKPDVASVEGKTTTAVPDEEASVSQFTAVLVKHGDSWQIDSIEEMSVPQPPTAYDALKDLEWLNGTWMDDSKDSPVISTFCWSGSKSFLIRTFASKEGEETTPLGTQIIGWDPRSHQIRSWTFNSDGSFGDGVWSKSGKDWLIKSTQTLADGRAASGTYVISPVDDTKFTLKLIGNEVEGEPIPSSDPVSFVRLPEASNPVKQEAKPTK
jgi:uncharacterized protein (TIGR02246 family)